MFHDRLGFVVLRKLFPNEGCFRGVNAKSLKQFVEDCKMATWDAVI
jgi:hypothetical protein